MAGRFFRGRSDGVVAIYVGDNDAPMDDPLGNLPNVLFHSELLYPAIVAEHTGTLSLPSRGANDEGHAGHTLFAHGRSGTPLVIGYATLDSKRVGLCGSVPVQMGDAGWSRWIALGADATDVMIAESWFTETSSGFSGIDVPWVCYVLDAEFDGADPPPPGPPEIVIEPTEFRTPNFDAAKRYLRAGNTLSNFPVCRSRTLDANLEDVANFQVVRLRYSVNGYVMQSDNGGSFDADMTLVTT